VKPAVSDLRDAEGVIRAFHAGSCRIYAVRQVNSARRVLQ